MTSTPLLFDGLVGKVLVRSQGTRPISPERYVGQHIYEVDTGRTMRYNGSGWSIVGEYGGVVAFAQKIDRQSNIGPTSVDILGLSVSVTPVIGRRYLIEMDGMVGSNAAGDYTNVFFTDGSNNQFSGTRVHHPDANTTLGFSVRYIWTPVSGSATTIKGRIVNANAIGGQSYIDGLPQAPITLTVTDVGSV